MALSSIDMPVLVGILLLVLMARMGPRHVAAA
jgi:hypothetical protein